MFTKRGKNTRENNKHDLPKTGLHSRPAGHTTGCGDFQLSPALALPARGAVLKDIVII